MSVPALLAQLAGRRQFIAYRVVPKPDKPGKTDKLPTNPWTGENYDAQDPRNWLSAEEAAQVHAAGWPIGLVLTPAADLFCIDLDSALQPDGTWSPYALEVCARFPGAALEVSASGRGLHILGSCQPVPAHRTRRKGLPLEVYTRERFIGLTGTGLVGDIRTDLSPHLVTLLLDSFEDPSAVSIPDEWTTAPVAGWRGGGTDSQIVQTLINRQSARAVFGGGASFGDLWHANVDALQQAFPDSGPTGYDESAADQALANHLAYATGYNCEHTLALMRQSKLARDKWERADYLPRTILRAVAGKIPAAADVAPAPPSGPDSVPLVTSAASLPAPRESEPLADPAGAALEPYDGAPVIIPTAPNAKPGGYAPGHYLLSHDQAALFAGCVYVRDVHQILMPDGAMLSSGPFNAHFGGLSFQMTADGQRPSKEAWNAFLFSEVSHFPRVDGVLFSPKLQPRQVEYRDGQKLLNTWVPVYIEKRPGDVSRFLDHLKRLYPVGNDADILLAYLAAIVQHQGIKFRWAPMLQGVEGNGKTFFSQCVEYAIGARYTHWPRADMLGKQFNAAFYGKLLVCVEDVKITEARESLWETLKPMITGLQLEIEPKGVDSKVVRDVCFNFVLNTNHRNAIRKTEGDRRIAPLFSAQQTKAHLQRDGLTEDYFIRLYDWAAAGGYANIAHYLSTYAIPEHLNPALGMIRAPETSSTRAAIHAGRGAIEQEVYEAIEEGKPGFRGGWINSMAFDNLLAEIGKSRMLTRNARQELLEAMGFRLHPVTHDGRVQLADGSRPKLYVTAAPHVSEWSGVTVAEVAQLYASAQVR